MRRILLFGASDAGKTTYGAQLYERANLGGALKLRTTPEDMQVLESALESLANSRMPERTRRESYGTLILPVQDASGQAVDIAWPDYGGEQFLDILQQRILSQDWVERVREADGVLLMIRPETTRVALDVLEAPRRAQGPAERDDDAEAVPDLQPDAQYVEFLQLLRYVRNEGRLQRSQTPIVVLLSCWDELTDPGRPQEELGKRYPLLDAYLKGAWRAEVVQIYGLSATGDSLDSGIEGALRYADPSTRGYLVEVDGRHEPDLTHPVAWLLAQTDARHA